jgi:hypothetical protein
MTVAYRSTRYLFYVYLPCCETQEPPGQGINWSLLQQRLVHCSTPPSHKDPIATAALLTFPHPPKVGSCQKKQILKKKKN